MFSVYIFFTSLVLVNLLIAMMTNRYEQARRSAECTWRFNAVAFGLRFERLIAAVLRALGGRRLCRCDGQTYLTRCYPDTALRGRYLLEVRENTVRVGLSTQQQLHADITRLSVDMRNIGDRIDSLLRERRQ